MEKDFELDDFDELEIPDYGTIYDKVKTEEFHKKEGITIQEECEPIEESEDEKETRLANEFINKKYKKAYDCYCSQIRGRYGYLDEDNLPIDEQALNYASCKCNFDYDILKDKISKGEREFIPTWK